MAPTHQDLHPSNHPSRLADRTLPDPSAPGDRPEIDPDRGIRLEVLFITLLMLLGLVSTLCNWFA